MKTSLFVALLLLSTMSYSGVVIVEGKYQNKNLYVQNAYSGSGVGYSAYAVYVNEKLTNDEINSTAFEIDLSQLDLKFGEQVSIKIMHRDDATPPRVLNPDVLKPVPTFEILTMKMTGDGTITWTAKNENGALPYVIEQFRWNKWINVGQVEGIGTPGEHTYKFQVTSMHSGENKYRIRQTGYKSKYSSEVRVISSVPKCVFTMNRNSKQVDFTCGTLYEVYDFYGNIVKKGFGSRIDIANLERGGYYICYDNSIGEIRKR